MAPLDLTTLLPDFDHTARLDQIEVFVERPRAPSRAIVNGLQRKPGRHYLFCGSIGSGKSSELAFLGHLLNQSVEPRYFVIGLDAYQSIDTVSTLRPAEMLMLIGAAVVRTYQDWHSKKIPTELLDQLREAFSGATERKVEPARIFEGVALMTWGIATADLGTTGKAVGSLAGAMGALLRTKRRAPIGGLTRASAREGDPDVAALLDAVNDLLDHVREHDGREPVLLIDGLDKIDRVEDMGTIRQLFCARLLSTVRASCIYCAPITMMLQTEWHSASSYFDRERLTNVVVEAPAKECEPALIEQGRALMREVVLKRLALRRLGEADVFEPGALDDLIVVSGGVLRTLVHLVGTAIGAALDNGSVRVTRADVAAAIHELGHEFEITMNGERRKELELIKAHGEPSGKDTALELLLNNYVLHYRNGHSWWAPAPLVARLLR